MIEIYDTVKVYRNKICFLDKHIQRFNNALEELYNKKIDILELKRGCLNLLNGQNIEEGAVRFSYNVEKDTLEFKTRTTYYNKLNNKGMSIGFSTIKKDENNEYTYYKTNTFDFLKERNESKYDELISQNNNGYISEGSISNIFIIKNKKVYTPNIQSGILCGIMREIVIDICKYLNISITEQELTKEDLKNADEIFITNALMGVMPINKVEDRVLDITKYDLTIEIKNEVINKWKKEVENG